MDSFRIPSSTQNSELAAAVHRNDPLSSAGMLERLFTFLFSGLVYPLIWEDPIVDMAALNIKTEDHIVAIASGGCNIASYLIAQPQKITAVDLNATHVALNRLKLTAIQHFPDHVTLHRFFAHAANSHNSHAYDQYLAPYLDHASRSYWEQKDHFGRRYISRFERGFYHYGLLGRFIGLAHFIAKVHGANLERLLQARTREEQRLAFETILMPLFEKPLIRFLASQPASLYGLGIPPAQYHALAADHTEGMVGALRERVRRLTCDFDFQDNYFAWQAFQRSFGQSSHAPVPPYLQKEHFHTIRDCANRVDVHQISMTTFLSNEPANSKDCYILLDAQDWMTDADLNALWSQITRTARQNARVIFRTAANEKLLPNRVNDELLKSWRRNDQKSDHLHTQDRSAIYGAFHLYEFQEMRGV
ncbi:MAG: DUF3419 family protein [Methylocystaceae bacterium]|nr:DUF3419 family protein [Methylocystaceae bacterium]